MTQITEYMEKHHSESFVRSSKLIKDATLAEMEFMKVLDFYGIKYKFNAMVFNEKGCFFVDFRVSIKPKTFFEIDGGYHNDRKEYDNWRENIILNKSSSGYKKYEFIRFTNEEVFDGTAEKIVAKRFSRFCKEL